VNRAKTESTLINSKTPDLQKSKLHQSSWNKRNE